MIESINKETGYTGLVVCEYCFTLKTKLNRQTGQYFRRQCRCEKISELDRKIEWLESDFTSNIDNIAKTKPELENGYRKKFSEQQKELMEEKAKWFRYYKLDNEIIKEANRNANTSSKI